MPKSIYKADPEGPIEMILAGELLTEFGPVCNIWLASMAIREIPSSKVVIAMNIAFSTEMSVLLKLITTTHPEKRRSVAEAVVQDLGQRILALVEIDTDVSQTPESSNGSHS